jgi:hypothetical protein
MESGEEQLSGTDIKYADVSGGGFCMVRLRDADDGDVIILTEDDIISLYRKLKGLVEKHRLE